MTDAEHGSGDTAVRSDAPRAGTAVAADAEGLALAEDTTAAAGTPDAPAPLASLTSLLGGRIEGGMSCAVDGTCD